VIALIDYGSGNIRSVQKALQKVGAKVELVHSPENLRSYSAVVLPGVGAFDDCVNALEKQAMLRGIRDFIETGKPFLGICVGYQALFQRSEEFNSCAAGLGLFNGRVVRFPSDGALKVPQIGWNKVEVVQKNSPLFDGIPSGSHFYFVHSYFPLPEDRSIVAGQTVYGCPFASAVSWRNVHATQFHPEKSQKTGLKLLENFVKLT
jgi:glutamine amidotransferase